MPRAKPQSGRNGREAQDVGAAIIATWLKALASGPGKGKAKIVVSNITPGKPPIIEVQPATKWLQNGDLVFFRGLEGQGAPQLNDWPQPLLVSGLATSGGATTFSLSVPNGTPTPPPFDGSMLTGYSAKSGSVMKVTRDPSDANIRDDLEYALEQILQVTKVNVVFDQATQGGISVVVPRIPNGVYTRQDLLEYLQDYHDQSENRQYHRELGQAILMGCR